jgi:predicted DCC family thiol-disulfide oxidoreductase YuxK
LKRIEDVKTWSLIVVYDDSCGLCLDQMRRLKRLDWIGLLDFRPLSGAEALAQECGLAESDLRRFIHCVDAAGKVSRGARCLRRVAARTPLLAPLALLLWLPGALWLAEKVYLVVSRNRHRIGRPLGRKSER